MTKNRVIITGDTARNLKSYASQIGKWWTEVGITDTCPCGCKIYARRRGCITQYRISHSATYGCRLGRDEATMDVPVSIRIVERPMTGLMRAELRRFDADHDNCACPTRPAPEIRGDDADVITDHDPACLVLADLEG